MKNKKSEQIILKDVDLIDGEKNRIQKDMMIGIKDGVIENVERSGELEIPKETEVISLSGRIVISGMIDSHVHLFQSGVDDFMKPYAERLKTKFKRNCSITIESGVTTVRNMPGYDISKYRKKVKQGEIPGPRIIDSGPAISVPYSYFSKLSYMPFNAVLRFFMERIYRIKDLSIDVKNEKEAREAVKKIEKKGADFIKTITPGSNYPYAEEESYKQNLLEMGLKEEQIEASMDPEILKAITEQARKEDMKVACHNIYGPEGFSLAVEAGADSIEHSPIGLIDEETLELMVKNEVFWVPTIYAFYNWKNLIDNPDKYDSKEIKELIPEPLHSFGKKSLEKIREDIEQGGLWSKFYDEIDSMKEEYFPKNLERAMEKGVKIAAGVDCGAGGAGYVPHGQLYKELEVYVDNGMDEFSAIQTATKNAAELLGLDEKVGTIEKGKIGDLVVLGSDPLDDISNMKDVELVIKEGKILYSEIDVGG